jgi:hypothetical protein
MSTFSLGSVVWVNNRMQSNYTYKLTAPMGEATQFFSPLLTPKEMLAAGIFNGHYMTDCRAEYPADWFENAKLSQTPDKAVNFFAAKSGDSLAYWRARGWIYKDDPRGWFEWYCRYYLGRRCADDIRQMSRWRLFAPRHAGMLVKFGEGDKRKRAATRQSLLHWAHDPLPDVPFREGQTVYQKMLRCV